MPTAISPEQLAANRANATHSTGPVTAEGKATSSRNRSTHGFRSSTVLLPGDDPAEYNELLTELEDHFGEPRDITESRFIREMADADWRLRRVRDSIESAIARHMQTLSARHPELDATDLQSRAIETLAETGCSYSTWLRYETKFERQYDRANNGWTRYQQASRRDAATNRKTARDQAMSQPSVISPPATTPAMGSNVQSPPVQPVSGPATSVAASAQPSTPTSSESRTPAHTTQPDKPTAAPAASPVPPQSHVLQAA